MLNIYVYGTNNDRSNGLVNYVREAADNLGIEHNVWKISDPAEISRAGILFTPSIAVDGEVVCAGEYPTVERIQNALLKWAQIDDKHLVAAFKRQYQLITECFTEHGVEYGDACGSIAPSIALHILDGILDQAKKMQREDQ